MKFGQAIQLGIGQLKQEIKKSESKKEKGFWIWALAAKSLICVISAIIVISVLNSIFGPANSSAAVVIFCILMAVFFVDFNYRLSDSLINLGLCFALLTFGPWLAQQAGGIVGFFVNFFCLLAMFVMVAGVPIMGNAGLYSFSYIFLMGNHVIGKEFGMRIVEMFVGFLICGIVFCVRHRHKDTKRSFREMVEDFHVHNHLSIWQIRLALGVSLVLFFTQIFGLERAMWAGFACSSVLSPFESNLPKRAVQRIVGVLMGSFLFWIVYLVWPPSLRFFFGPVAGVILGFCSTYHWNTVLNCFGALLLASGIYGVGGAVGLRILNNILGAVFAVIFYYVFQWVYPRIFKKSSNE